MNSPFIVAVAGNPNCGKTTLFNALTGLRYKVANYPGVTVERKEGTLKSDLLNSTDPQIIVWDLPGTYALGGTSLDEKIASQSLLGQIPDQPVPDLILAVVDATNLERNLYLASQLADLGMPIIVVLNMIDLAQARGISVRSEILAREVGAPVLKISARSREGLSSLTSEIINISRRSGEYFPEPQLSWIPDESREIFIQSCRSIGSDATVARSAIMLGAVRINDPFPAPITQQVRTTLNEHKIDCSSFEATHRYMWIGQLVKKSMVVASSAKESRRFLDLIDHLSTHRITGMFGFILIMGTIFQAIFLWATVPMDLIDSAMGSIGSFVGSVMPEGILRSLIVDGIIAGVGSVVIFIPQIAILFFFLGLLEDSGYLSRAAFLMDRVMRPFGLQGRSFIPLLSSFACAIPGIMSTRTIPSFTDRLTTILVAPLMSCSARLPVYTILIAAFIPNQTIAGVFSLQGLTMLALYLMGILGAACVSWVLKHSLLRGAPTPFVMEMPPFRLPAIATVLREVLDRVVLFLKNAGTVILACSIVLWFLASFPAGDIQQSFAGRIGHLMEPMIAPLGFNWEIGIALLASFAAREVFVSTLATVYNLQDSSSGAESLLGALQQRHADGTFSLATALSLLVFYVFACQCMSTLAVARRETGSWKWVLLMFGYMTVLAYVASWVAYRIAS